MHPLERAASLAGAVGCFALAAVRRTWGSIPVLALGGALLHRAVTGHSLLYARLKVSTAHGVRGPSASVPHHQGVKLVHTLTVRQPPERVYRFWRELDNLPRFMHHLESVTVLDERRSRWRVRGPADISVSWDAEIINDVPGELIAWRSLEGAEVPNAGSVRFERGVGGHTTRITVNLEYHPPAGVIGNMISSALGANPEKQIESDLQRFKELLETNVPHADAPQRGRLRDVRDLETARQVLQLDDLTKN
ncbi:SRPBCC family protein [Nannocystis exedens]|uniref:SRPBCC family protein n=1 Tax=Nannocystis exedens TaxID=54 RepID=UPI0014761E58|nr:SRPBCC family protein [Nannocystis exedens]